VPVNRNYVCNPGNRDSGDKCLGEDGGHDFSTIPSQLTLGVRVYPWFRGLELLGAIDLGTSGTSNFIEEVAPTPPWDLWLGLGYAFDTVERAPVVKTVTVERVVGATGPEHRIRGFVHEKDKQEGVANAIVHFEGRDLTGLATGGDGRFTSSDLTPGAYTLSVHADGFKDGQCTVVVAPTAPSPAPQPATPSAVPGAPQGPGAPQQTPGAPMAATTAAAPAPQPPVYFDADCPLEALPRTGNVTGRVADAEGMSAIASATIKLTDTQGKELQVASDGNGSFRFESLQPGTVNLKIEADGYMLHVQSVDVRAREDANAEVLLHKRPKAGLVEVGPHEIKIKQQVHFETDSAKIQGDSTGLLEEIADTLARNPRLKRIEIQGHTDNQGAADHNKSLSDARASSVRDWLVAHGVEPSRLDAKGYGQDRPVAPNVTNGGRARNRRVQFIIVDQDAPSPGTKMPAIPTGGGGGTGGAAVVPKPKKPPAMPF
jgi:outer membrane protein OmpA-like peptidoglycan-associated protein